MPDDVSDRIKAVPARLFGDGRLRVRSQDLDGADLSGADLTHLAFKGVSLAGANLAGSVLSGVHMERVDLTDANLAGADLRGATLSRVDCAGADLSAADLCGADLDSVTLRGSTAAGAIFTGCNADKLDMVGADLTRARLDGAMLRSSKLTDTTVSGADFAGACLEQCHVSGVTFDDCDLSGVRVLRGQFEHTELTGCAMQGAAFQRTRFENVTVADSVLTAAFLKGCEGLSAEEVGDLLQAGAKMGADPAGLWRRKGNQQAHEGAEQPATEGPDLGRVGEELDLADIDASQGASSILASAKLSRLDCSGFQLRGANLSNADLRKVKLCDADLAGADLRAVEMAGVDLSRADLRGADLRGALLEDTFLVGAKLDNADLRGASLVAVNLSDATMAGARLDGCRIEEAVFRGVSFDEASAQGAVTAHSDFRDTVWRGCSLGGSRHTNPQFTGAVLGGCDLRGARLEHANLARIDTTDSLVIGCVLVRCHRLAAAEREVLEEGGARFIPSVVARTLQAIGRSRPLRWATLGTAAAAVVGTTVVALFPALWPTSVLMTRLATLEEPSTTGVCARYIRLGEVLQNRKTGDPERQVRLLAPLDSCYAGAGHQDERVRLLERSLSLLPKDSDYAHEVATALARAQMDNGGHEKAEQVVRTLLQDGAPRPEARFAALSLLHEIYLARGVDMDTDPRWHQLHKDLGDAVLSMPVTAQVDVGVVAQHATGLVRFGEIELAIRIVESLATEHEEPNARLVAREVLQQLPNAKVPTANATAFFERLQQSETLADREDLLQLLTYSQLELLLSTGQIDGAEAFVASQKTATASPSVYLAALLQARLDLEREEPKRALAALAEAGTTEGVSADLSAIGAMLAIEAHVAVRDDSGAVEVLVGHLQTLKNADEARRVIDSVATLPSGLILLKLLADRVETLDDPLIKNLLAERSVEAEILHRVAEAGEITADDPLVKAILDSSDPDLVQGVIRQLFDHAQDDTAFEDATRTVYEVAKTGHEDVRPAAAMLLVEYTLYSHGGAKEALRLARELDLNESARDGLLIEVAALAALEDGDTKQVDGYLAKALALDSPEGQSAAATIAERYVSFLRDTGRSEASLDVSRQALVHLRQPDARGRLRENAITCLITLNRLDEVAAEVKELAEETSACHAHRIEAQARESMGYPPETVEPLQTACAKAQTPAEDRLAAAEFMGERGWFREASALLKGIEAEDPAWRARRAMVVARALEGEGQPKKAVATLDAAYAETTDAWQREVLVHSMLDMLTNPGDGEAIVSTYLRFTTDHPEHEFLGLWVRAAEQLALLGEDDRIAALGGDPEWSDHLNESLQVARVRALVEAGKHDEAVDELLAVTTSTLDDGQLQEVGWLASELARATGDVTQALSVFEALADGAPVGSEARFSLCRDSAQLLGEFGRDKEAVAFLEPLLADDLPPHQLLSISEILPWLAGRCLDAAKIEKLLAKLVDRGLTADRVEEARVVAADALIQRGLRSDARLLLKPLEGQPQSAGSVRSRYPILLGAWPREGPSDPHTSLLTAFPPEAGEATCIAHLTILGHLPGDDDGVPKAIDRVKKECDVGHLGAWDLQMLVDVLGNQDRVEDASQMLDRHAAGVPQDERERLQLLRARLDAMGDDPAAARKALETLSGEASDTQIATEAMQILLAEVYPRDETSIEAVKQHTERLVTRVGPASAEAHQIRSQLVDFHRGRGQQSQAIELQSAILENLPAESGDDRALELLRMARLHLEKEASPTAVAHGFVDDAIAASSPGAHYLLELHALKAAFEVEAAARSGKSVSKVVRERHESLPDADRETFVANTAEELERFGLAELASEVRGAHPPQSAKPGVD